MTALTNTIEQVRRRMWALCYRMTGRSAPMQVDVPPAMPRKPRAAEQRAREMFAKRPYSAAEQDLLAVTA